MELMDMLKTILILTSANAIMNILMAAIIVRQYKRRSVNEGSPEDIDDMMLNCDEFSITCKGQREHWHKKNNRWEMRNE